MSKRTQEQFIDRRRAGVLLHPTSLPGPAHNGDLGPDAYRFVDYLVACGASVWQMLPIGPTHADGSPYQCLSVFAGNPQLVNLHLLETWGWLPAGYSSTVASDQWNYRIAALAEARHHFDEAADPAARTEWQIFRSEEREWLEDHALYCAIHRESGGMPWWEWPAPLRDRQPEALQQAREQHAATIEQVAFEQFLFFRQWRAIKNYANGRGIVLFGDLPIFVAQDSSDVWARRDYFTLDKQGQPVCVAGVPPDYFSETGQRWGNPLYRWDAMEADGFDWWKARVRNQLRLFDLIRIDHFRGFEAYWEIPADEPTAINGRWVEAPGMALFKTLQREFSPLPLVAEDLGLITDKVHALRRRFRLPGMKILQFAFGDNPENPYLPHRHEYDTVVYTGTHDNNTTLGWYHELPEETRHRIHDYLGFPAETMPWPLIRAAFASISPLAVVPMQDLLELDGSHRMNVPGTTEGNWQWRFDWSWLQQGSAERVRHLVWLYGRQVDEGPYRAAWRSSSAN